MLQASIYAQCELCFTNVIKYTVCGGRLVAQHTVDHLYSHAKFGDSDYDKKEDCDWVIEAGEGQRVRLRFLSFEVEHEQDCSYDYVEVFDGYDDSSSQLGRFCGNSVSRKIFHYVTRVI